MEDLRSRFETAAQDAQRLPKRSDNDTLLKLYAYYKQSTAGDVSRKRPGFTDPVGRAKWDAWSRLKGTAPDDAMQAYIQLVQQLKR